MMLKIVLVNTWRKMLPNLGLLYLASHIRQMRPDVDIVVKEYDIDDVRNHCIDGDLAGEQPQILGFTSVTANLPETAELMARMRNRLPEVAILYGGAHISSLPSSLPREVDAAVLHEGEETLVELIDLFMRDGHVTAAGLAQIEGVAFWKDGGVFQTRPRALMNDIDQNPMPAWDLLDMTPYLKPHDVLVNRKLLRGTSIITSRGCPFKCVFCQPNSLGKKIRRHSPEVVCNQIEYLYRNFQVEGIVISDDLFCYNRDHIRAIIDGLKSRDILGKISFMASAHAKLVDPELIGLLQTMGVTVVSMGLESGSERMLTYLKRGVVTVEDNRRAVRLLRQNGIQVYGLFMLGSPTETRDELQETYKFILENPIDTAFFSITTPLPGTELWRIALERGLIDEDCDWASLNPDIDRKTGVYMNENIPREEFVALLDDFRRLSDLKKMEGIRSALTLRSILGSLTRPRRLIKFVFNAATTRFAKRPPPNIN